MPWNCSSQLYDQLAASSLCFTAMDNQTQGIDRNLIHKNIDLNKIAGPKAYKLIIHRCIAATDTLEKIVKIIHYLSKRSVILKHHPGAT
jgi:hypothetical protein